MDVLHKLVESMPDRMAAVIATRGGSIRYNSVTCYRMNDDTF